MISYPHKPRYSPAYNYVTVQSDNNMTYSPVTAYTVTEPVIVNNVNINSGLYPILNYQPPKAQYPYLYVPIAEFGRVGTKVVWDDAALTLTVTTDYYANKQLIAEQQKMIAEQNRKINELQEQIDITGINTTLSQSEFNIMYQTMLNEPIDDGAVIRSYPSDAFNWKVSTFNDFPDMGVLTNASVTVYMSSMNAKIFNNDFETLSQSTQDNKFYYKYSIEVELQGYIQHNIPLVTNEILKVGVQISGRTNNAQVVLWYGSAYIDGNNSFTIAFTGNSSSLIDEILFSSAEISYRYQLDVTGIEGISEAQREEIYNLVETKSIFELRNMHAREYDSGEGGWNPFITTSIIDDYLRINAYPDEGSISNENILLSAIIHTNDPKFQMNYDKSEGYSSEGWEEFNKFREATIAVVARDTRQ